MTTRSMHGDLVVAIAAVSFVFRDVPALDPVDQHHPGGRALRPIRFTPHKEH